MRQEGDLEFRIDRFGSDQIKSDWIGEDAVRYDTIGEDRIGIIGWDRMG